VGGAAGPRSLALAARFGDEYNTTFAGADQCRERRTRWDAAWADAGRDGRARFSLMTGLLVGRDASEVEDRRRRLGETRGDPSFEAASPWLHGTLDEVREQLSELEAAGVDRVMCQLLLHDDLDQIELIASLRAA
jgi:alkanesulfonate monooxygenase SsuD/methylene tetrahydromethanopterin reductase-like flavin-dependent oxidoreductase (luciferase family)